MGDAFLFGGGGSSGGLREKPITKEAFLNLSEEDRKNPYIIWVIKNAYATDFTKTYGAEVVNKVICWDAYCMLSEEDRNNPMVVWTISDKTIEELSVLGIDTESGSKFYNIAGTPSNTNYSKVTGVDYALNINSTNPIANMTVTEEINKLKSAMGGLKFSVSESGGLRITYDDGK